MKKSPGISATCNTKWARSIVIDLGVCSKKTLGPIFLEIEGIMLGLGVVSRKDFPHIVCLFGWSLTVYMFWNAGIPRQPVAWTRSSKSWCTLNQLREEFRVSSYEPSALKNTRKPLRTARKLLRHRRAWLGCHIDSCRAWLPASSSEHREEVKTFLVVRWLDPS